MRQFRVVYLDRKGTKHAQIVRGESVEVVRDGFPWLNDECAKIVSVDFYTSLTVSAEIDRMFNNPTVTL